MSDETRPSGPVEPLVGRWLVPIHATAFGTMLELPHGDSLVIVLHRGRHGWRTPEHMPHVLLPHQVYAEKLLPLIGDATYEIVVVGLDKGPWVTVWARSDSEVLHAPPNAGVQPPPAETGC